MLKTGEQAPDLTVKTLDGKIWKLSESKPDNFTLLIAYRGYHCPLCKKQLEEINSKLEKIEKLGVKVFVFSHDIEEKAKKTKKEWNIDKLNIGYDLDLKQAAEWNLYFSKAISDKEPKYFTEPGVFLVKKNGELYGANISTMPFARPDLDSLIEGIKYIRENDYPPRGQVRDISLATF